MQQARQLCNTEDDISLRMQAFGRRAAGTLRFSVSHVRTDYFLRSYLIPFAKENPGISYQFHDATVEQQQQQLEAGSIDFAFANAPLPAAHNFATIKVQRESFYAFYNAEFLVPWANKSMLSPEDLAGVPLCCNYGSYALLRNVFKDYAVKPNVAFIATTAESALTFATSGLGVAVVAALESDAVPQGWCGGSLLMKSCILIRRCIGVRDINYRLRRRGFWSFSEILTKRKNARVLQNASVIFCYYSFGASSPAFAEASDTPASAAGASAFASVSATGAAAISSSTTDCCTNCSFSSAVSI